MSMLGYIQRCKANIYIYIQRFASEDASYAHYGMHFIDIMRPNFTTVMNIVQEVCT